MIKTYSKKLVAVGFISSSLLLTVGLKQAKSATFVEKEVPFVWKLEQTTGPKKNNTSVFVQNNGPSGNVVPGSDTLSGNFKITKMHNAPAGWERVDPLPTTVDLSVASSFTGTYANSTLNIDILGLPFESYVKASANLSIAGITFTPIDVGGFASGDINQNRTATLTLGEGTVNYNGNVDVDTKFGFGGQNLDFITVFAQLTVNGQLLNPTVSITYRKEVPEPLTIFGAGAALAALPSLKREYAKRKKKTKTQV